MSDYNCMTPAAAMRATVKLAWESSHLLQLHGSPTEASSIWNIARSPRPPRQAQPAPWTRGADYMCMLAAAAATAATTTITTTTTSFWTPRQYTFSELS